MQKETLLREFIQYFGDSQAPIHIHFASGRVNLLGEHTDYNGGYVFPVAISLGITAIFRKRKDTLLKLKSADFEQIESIDLKQGLKKTNQWTDYCKGVYALLKKQGILKEEGYDLYFKSTLPMGAGLSSSACMEILCLSIFLGKADFSEGERIELALMAKKVENEFIGLNCGIMDMFAIALGKNKEGIMLHCDESLAFEYVPLEFEKYKLLIINSNKPRKLVESKYNERKAQCDQALSILQKHHPLKNLSEANLEMLEKHLKDPLILKRALHILTENARVLKAVQALKKADLHAFGTYMYASHQSLKDNYEVTGKELDCIVEKAINLEGCLGARMTGAGFGGCCIALVEEKKLADFKIKLNNHYNFEIGYPLSFYETSIVEGLVELH